MPYDIIFLSTNVYYLILPLVLLFFNKLSAYLGKYNTQTVDDEQLFSSNNIKFHLLFKLIFYSGIIISISSIVTIIIINSFFIQLNRLIQIDFTFFLLVIIYLVLSFSVLFILSLSLLYYRLKPDSRHPFIQRLSTLLSIISLTGSATSLLIYYGVLNRIIKPIIVLSEYRYFNQSEEIISLIFLSAFIFILFYTITYKKYCRKRTQINAKLYSGFYFIMMMILMVLTFINGNKYFELSLMNSSKLNLFSHQYGFAGIMYLFLSLVSAYSIVFAIFIYNKKDKFIGSQFAVSYTLKLAGLNYLSTVVILIICALPYLLLNYFNLF